MRAASTNSTARWPSFMPARAAAARHSSRTPAASGRSGRAGRARRPRTSTSIISAIAALGVLVVGLDDALDEFVAHDVLGAEGDELDVVELREHVPDDDQSRALLGRQVDLRDDAGDDHLRAEAEPREEHLHLLWRGVLGLVEDDERVVDRPSAHEGKRRDLDHTALEVAGDLLGVENVA